MIDHLVDGEEGVSHRKALEKSDDNKQYPVLNGKLNFKKFETSKINDCIEFIKSMKLHIGGSQPLENPGSQPIAIKEQIFFLRNQRQVSKDLEISTTVQTTSKSQRSLILQDLRLLQNPLHSDFGVSTSPKCTAGASYSSYLNGKPGPGNRTSPFSVRSTKYRWSLIGATNEI